ncbi:MAG TPA: glycogen debranching N-terminal domain-containing protein, partial [Gemmatimonadaceae bacterium]|nr:glycogen debranching N-terminal domain-containing protein [Gemmatimonadaceae bacterium]
MKVEQELAPAPTSMEAAVGYPAIDCRHGASVQDALVLKHERIFLLLNERGDVTPPGHCGLGFFHDDTRMLSHYELLLAGAPATVLSSQVVRMYSSQVDLAVDDTAFGGDSWNVSNAVHVRRELLIDDRLTERITLTNFLERSIDFWAELHFANDFADIFEVRGWRRAERGTFYEPVVAERSVIFSYRGRDGELITSGLVFDDEPDEIGPRRARWRFRLDPHRPRRLEWHGLVNPSLDGSEMDTGRTHRHRDIERRRIPLETAYDRWRAGCTHFSSNVAEFNSAL